MIKRIKWNSNQLRFSTWAGIIAPVLFVGIFALEGTLRSGYVPAAMYISALSLGSRGWIQITNFLVFGILLLVFARGTAAKLYGEGQRRSGSTLLTLIAILYTLSGPFVMDPTGTPTSQASIHGIIHGLAGGFVFLLMPITMFVFLRHFRSSPAWQNITRWTLGLGVIEAAAVVFFTLSSKLPALQTASSPWQGFIQRAALIPFMLWLAAFAGTLLLRNQPGDVQHRAQAT